MGVEGAGEFLGDGGRGGALDGGALHEVDELAVAQDGDGGRAGRIAGEVVAGALGGFGILPGEDGDGLAGGGGVLQGHAHGGTHLAGGASADGVDHQQGGSGLGQRGIHLGGGAGFLDAGAGELFAHGDEHDLWVHEASWGSCTWCDAAAWLLDDLGRCGGCSDHGGSLAARDGLQ